MNIFTDTHIDFLGKKYIAFCLSGILTVAAVLQIIFVGLPMGIDFVGGNMIHLKYRDLPTVDQIRSALDTKGFGTSVIQPDVERGEVIIRVQMKEAATAAGSSESQPVGNGGQEQVVERVLAALMTPEEADADTQGKVDINLIGSERLTDILLAADPLKCFEQTAFPDGIATPQAYARSVYGELARQLIDRYREVDVEGLITDFDAMLAGVRIPEDHRQNKEAFDIFMRDKTYMGRKSLIRAEMVSAVVGAELADQATAAVIYSLAGILIYIWFRFNPRFSVAAIIATVHDVIVTVGLFAITGREYNLPIVAAVLTIVGYSLNDTIVVFDRIRENLNTRRREAKEDYEGVLNDSINQTLSRTILTSSTTLFVVLCLFLLGGSVINDFAFVLLVGIVVGTYSSIFIASPVLAIWYKVTGTMGGVMGRTRLVKA